jgi:hypothetical protein
MSGLLIDPTIARFTRAEIVAEMSKRFGPITESTFRHYQELGLVAAARSRRFAKGKAGSAPAMWSFNDKEQLAAILEIQRRHVEAEGKKKDLSWLGNYVVWSWVFWDGFVELDQARRALRTWVEPQVGGAAGGARSKAAIAKPVRMTVDQVAAPGVSLSNRKATAAKITEDLWHDDLTALRSRVPELHTIVDPAGTGRRVGTPGVSVDAWGEIERLYMVHSGAKAVITGEPPIPDAQWYNARGVMRHAWTAYSLNAPHLRAQATHPDWFNSDVGTQMSRASSSLLLILGELLTGRTPGLGEYPGRGLDDPATSGCPP